jgi:hypothetical protein
LVNTTLCFDAGAKSEHPILFLSAMVSANTRRAANWKDMASITLQNCSDTADGQKWNAMADGRIALDLSSPRTIPKSSNSGLVPY